MQDEIESHTAADMLARGRALNEAKTPTRCPICTLESRKCVCGGKSTSTNQADELPCGIKLEPQATAYALFKDGKQVSKAHSTRYAVEIEALEAGLVSQHEEYRFLDERYEIKCLGDGD